MSSPQPLSPAMRMRYATWLDRAVERMPYLAPILFAFAPLDSPGLETMACDKGLRLYLDMEYITTQRSDSWAVDGLLHETGHVFGDHFARSASIVDLYDRQAQRDFNIAGDMAINPDMIHGGCKSLATGEDPVPSMIEQPDYLTPEHYYKIIRQARSGSDGDGGDQPYAGCGSISGGEPAPCEIPADGGGRGDDFAALDTDEVGYLVSQAAEKMSEHHSSGRGTVPGGLLSQAGIILTPPAKDWRQMVMKSVGRSLSSSGRRRSTTTKPSRRRRGVKVGGKPVFFPGTYRTQHKIVVIRDTSGSMTDRALGIASGQIISICRRLGVRGDNLLVVDVDTVAHDPVPMTHRKVLTTIRGRGGTDMRKGFDQITEYDLDPSAVVVITDLETPWPKEKPRYPVTVVAVCTKEAFEDDRMSGPEWADTVHADIARTP